MIAQPWLSACKLRSIFNSSFSPILYRTIVIKSNHGVPDESTRLLFAGVHQEYSSYAFGVNEEYDDDEDDEESSEGYSEFDFLVSDDEDMVHALRTTNRNYQLLDEFDDSHVISEYHNPPTSAARRELLHHTRTFVLWCDNEEDCQNRHDSLWRQVIFLTQSRGMSRLETLRLETFFGTPIY